jgi:hypothetical protein
MELKKFSFSLGGKAMCSPLKHKLIDHPEPAWMVARKIGKNDSWMSKVTRGLIEPKPHEKDQLAEELGTQVEEIFPSGRGAIV